MTCDFNEIDGLERICRQGRHDHEVRRVRGKQFKSRFDLDGLNAENYLI
jgi:hypothetical protein